MADSTNAAISGGEQGAAAGSVAGPYGAAIGGAAGVVAGLINSDKSQPTPDLTPLFTKIAQSGAYEQSLINQLPASLQPLYAQYKASLGAAGSTLQSTTGQIGQDLTNQTAALYDPNGPAATATLAAMKQQDYSTLPGTLNSLKSSLAATGGLENGGAAKAITNAVMSPAAAYSQQAANVQGQQLTAQQSAVSQAIQKVASMNDATAQQLFGMSTAQATTILSSGRQDLVNQLSQLINQSTTQTNQELSLLGTQAGAGYQNQVAANNANAAVVNGLTNTGAQLIGTALAPSSSGNGTSQPISADAGSNAYSNALANNTANA